MKETFGYYELTDAGKGNPAGELWIEALNAAIAYIKKLERERDALLDALKKADVYGDCENCKYRDSAPADCDCECGSCKRNCRCWECRDGDKWEWRGVKIGESQESE